MYCLLTNACKPSVSLGFKVFGANSDEINRSTLQFMKWFHNLSVSGMCTLPEARGSYQPDSFQSYLSLFQFQPGALYFLED